MRSQQGELVSLPFGGLGTDASQRSFCMRLAGKRRQKNFFTKWLRSQVPTAYRQSWRSLKGRSACKKHSRASRRTCLWDPYSKPVSLVLLFEACSRIDLASAIAMPMMVSEAKRGGRPSTRKRIEVILHQAEAAFRRAVEHGGIVAQAEDARRARLDLALLQALQTSLQCGSSDATRTAADLLGVSSIAFPDVTRPC